MQDNILSFTPLEICRHIDHTLLRQDATSHEIARTCNEGIAGNAASVCIPPSFVNFASEYVQNNIAICTVIGFPNGYSTTASKVFEAAEAVTNGADEVDMVINIGWLKEGAYAKLQEEISAVKKAVVKNILKVIIETCLLTNSEKIEMCKIVSASGADYIKTSTGFSTGGATAEDIRLFKEHGEGLLIKASGGVSNADTAALFLSLGASRLGSSSLLNALKEE